MDPYEPILEYLDLYSSKLSDELKSFHSRPSDFYIQTTGGEFIAIDKIYKFVRSLEIAYHEPYSELSGKAGKK